MGYFFIDRFSSPEAKVFSFYGDQLSCMVRSLRPSWEWVGGVWGDLGDLIIPLLHWPLVNSSCPLLCWCYLFVVLSMD